MVVSMVKWFLSAHFVSLVTHAMGGLIVRNERKCTYLEVNLDFVHFACAQFSANYYVNIVIYYIHRLFHPLYLLLGSVVTPDHVMIFL